jgi:hypothetical protein
MKISRYQQFKIFIGSLKHDYMLAIITILCYGIGLLARYILYGFSYSLFSVLDLVYWLRDFIYLVFMFHLGKYIGRFSEQYFQYCINFRREFLRQNMHIIEWESKNYHHENKGMLTNGDILGIKLVKKLMKDKVYLTNMESVKEWISDFPDQTKYYIWKNSNIRDSWQFAVSAMNRYLDTKAWYYVRKSKERLSFYHEELIKEAWSPERAFEWCENSLDNYLDDND